MIIPTKERITAVWFINSNYILCGSRPVYFHPHRAGVVFCCDFKTGKQCYSERITQSCWATPLAVGDRIYFFGKRQIIYLGKEEDLKMGFKNNTNFDDFDEYLKDMGRKRFLQRFF